MTTVRDLIDFFDTRAPKALSLSWDNDGVMLVPDASREVKKILCALDVTERTADEAIELGCDTIISHHPFIFFKLARIDGDDVQCRLLCKLMEHRISVLSYHTRLDATEGGVNDTLCRVLGIVDAVPFGEEAVGRIGTLRAPATLAAFCNTCKDVLGSPVVHCVSAKKPVSRVAVLGGGGGDDWMNALKAGADTYVTGSIGYNALLGAKAEGLNVIMAGHYYTEVPVLDTLKAWLSELCPEVEVLCAETPCEVLTV